MRLVREDEIREGIGDAFDHERARLARLLPGARVEHIGSTAVPGSLTKGDLDICVIVGAAGFEDAVRALGEGYVVHQPENWNEAFASFVAPAENEVAIGVQLIVEGGQEEGWFVGWRERLRSDPELRARYDRVKREHADGPVEDYRAAKERVILGAR